MLSADYVRDVIRPAACKAAVGADRDPDALKFHVASFLSVDEDREVARRRAREALCALFDPLPHPYYEYTLREQGFSDAADAALHHMPAGELDRAVEAFPDECIDRVAIAGTPEECLARLATYQDTVDEVVCVNVTPPASEDPKPAYDSVFALANAYRA